MQASFEKMLREQSREVAPQKPTDNQVKIALLAFAGMTVGQIRTEAETDIETIGNSVRAVRDAIRAGKAPAEVMQQFPDLAAEQLVYGKGEQKPGRASPALLAKLNSASRGLDKPPGGRLSHWVDTVLERFAPVLVPLTIRKLAEGVERGEPDMIKLSAQSFRLVPGAKGTMIAQKFEFSGGQPQIPAAPVQEGNAPYFEDILRKARAKIDAGRPALQATDMEVPKAEESEDDE